MDQPSVDIRAYPSERGFRIGLYEEHLEEASFLYGQVRGTRQDERATWTEPEAEEERLEAHLDGLAVGGDLALDVCRTRLPEGDSGILHASMRLFCRKGCRKEVFAALKKLAADDEEAQTAFWAAMKHDLPPGWERPLMEACLEKGESLPAKALDLFGHRRFSLDWAEIPRVYKAGAIPLVDVSRYVGKIREPNFAEGLSRIRKTRSEADLLFQSSLALLRIGDRGTYVSLARGDRPFVGETILLGLTGSRECGSRLLALLNAGDVGPEVLLALGRLGYADYIDILVEAIGSLSNQEAAARALNLMTGADLPIDVEKEPCPSEDAPIQLSMNPDRWRGWLRKNNKVFRPGIRYRRGMPLGPAALVKVIMDPSSSNWDREGAIEEIAIQFGVDFGLETEMEVRSQKECLRKLQEWMKTGGKRFEAGFAYFGGVRK
ncbi:MAG TPA: hypothetical protein VK465_18585 [Fibrobacteria bacterium]|nr:hypothetical protein [Fibrobacteria bacterium]